MATPELPAAMPDIETGYNEYFVSGYEIQKHFRKRLG
jgi:hypothetical protein